MGYVTAKKAADMTGLSERTIRRYVDSGRLPAKQIARNRLAINVDDLPAKKTETDDKLIAELSLQISEMRGQISAISKRTAQLEHLLSAKGTMIWDSTAETSWSSAAKSNNQEDITYTAITGHTTGQISGQHHSRGLPPGLISLNTFCEQHHIPVTTVKAAFKRGELAYHSGLWKVGPARVEYALDDNEQAAILERYG